MNKAMMLCFFILACRPSNYHGEDMRKLTSMGPTQTTPRYNLDEDNRFFSNGSQKIVVCAIDGECNEELKGKIADAICRQENLNAAIGFTISTDDLNTALKSYWFCDLQTYREVELCAWSYRSSLKSLSYFQQIKCQ
jgi:hypothetical protein